MIAGLLAEDGPHNSGPDFGKASPFGLLVVVLLLIGTVFLVRSMNRHLKKAAGVLRPRAPRTGSGRRRRHRPSASRCTSRRRRPDDEPRLSPAANTLGAATSPYLRQHADNPVHWQQWTPRGAGRGRRARRADPAVDRLRRLPLVPRDGPRIVRGRRRGRRDERGLRLHQGRPRGAARHRRGLHERHRRAHRAGRLADDVLPDSRRAAVLLRHLLPESRLPAAAFGGVRDLAGPPRRGRAGLRPDRRRIARRWRPGCPAAARVSAGAVRPRRRRGAARRGHGARRIRRRAEVPAVGAARGAAAAL